MFEMFSGGAGHTQLYIGLTPASPLRMTMWGDKNWTWVSHIKGKNFNHRDIVPVPT